MTTALSLARRAVVFEIALYRSLFRWVTRRPDVPAGGVAFSYVGAVALLLWVFISVSAVELVVVHLLLPWETIRLVADILGIWGLIWMLGLAASYSVHPHVVTESGLRIRQGHGDRRHRAVGRRRHRRRAGAQPRHVQGAAGRPQRAGRRSQRRDGQPDRRRRYDCGGRCSSRCVGGEEPVTEIRLYADDPRALVRRGARAPGAGGSAQALVDVAPAPGLAGLEAAHHRVLGLVEVRVGVPLGRGVAAADVAAGQAEPEVHPAGAVPQALLAALGSVRAHATPARS